MESVFECKCCFISFTRKRKLFHFRYSLSGTSLGRLEHLEYLAVFLSSDLSWHQHRGYVTGKVNIVLNFIKRNFKSGPKSFKVALYVTNARSILEYAGTVWDRHGQTLIYKLERIQNRASRFVSGNYNFDSTISRIKNELGWKRLQQRRKFLR